VTISFSRRKLMVPRRKFEPKRGGITKDWEIKYISMSFIICICNTQNGIKFRLMRWTCYLACMGENEIQHFGRETSWEEITWEGLDVYEN
jgi:hypothetical protein